MENLLFNGIDIFQFCNQRKAEATFAAKFFKRSSVSI